MKNLIEHTNSNSTEIKGQWAPSRPINWKHRKLRQRLTASTGREVNNGKV